MSPSLNATLIIAPLNIQKYCCLAVYGEKNNQEIKSTMTSCFISLQLHVVNKSSNKLQIKDGRMDRGMWQGREGIDKRGQQGGGREAGRVGRREGMKKERRGGREGQKEGGREGGKEGQKDRGRERE